MSDAIFLSAGVPDPKRSPDYAKTADTVAIGAAISALMFVVLGRRSMVWGGQPGITPMIWVAAEALDLDYGRWVTLYQTEYFRDEFPEDNKKFENVVYTPAADGRESSLLTMRERMFKENTFSAAIFIGGMAGIVDEFELFRAIHPNATILPVLSTGGAVLEIPNRLMMPVAKDWSEELDYVALFHRYLGIPAKERRYKTPEQQPELLKDRLWQRP